MNNTLTLQPKRGGTMKRSLTTVGASEVFGRKPLKKSSIFNQTVPPSKPRATVMDLLGSDYSSSDEDEADDCFGGHMHSPTQNRTSLKRHVSLMAFPVAPPPQRTRMTRSNGVLDKTGYIFNPSSTTNTNNIPTIGVETFHSIMKDHQMQLDKFCRGLFNDLVVIDCRFPFEFEGGHIDGAINVTTITELEDVFFNKETLDLTPLEFTNRQRKLVIFHCEFSSMRGPLRASQLRDLDRQHSGNDNYPNLYYPDVLILQGGYKLYFDSLPVAHNRGYIEMDHPQYEEERERGLTLLRQESRTSLRR